MSHNWLLTTDNCPITSDAIKKLFDQVKRGKLSPDEAVQRLRHLPFEDLGFANVDLSLIHISEPTRPY